MFTLYLFIVLSVKPIMLNKHYCWKGGESRQTYMGRHSYGGKIWILQIMLQSEEIPKHRDWKTVCGVGKINILVNYEEKKSTVSRQYVMGPGSVYSSCSSQKSVPRGARKTGATDVPCSGCQFQTAKVCAPCKRGGRLCSGIDAVGYSTSVCHLPASSGQSSTLHNSRRWGKNATPQCYWWEEGAVPNWDPRAVCFLVS